jgi:hypothetical protein
MLCQLTALLHDREHQQASDTSSRPFPLTLLPSLPLHRIQLITELIHHLPATQTLVQLAPKPESIRLQAEGRGLLMPTSSHPELSIQFRSMHYTI